MKKSLTCNLVPFRLVGEQFSTPLAYANSNKGNDAVQKKYCYENWLFGDGFGKIYFFPTSSGNNDEESSRFPQETVCEDEPISSIAVNVMGNLI